MRTSPRTLFPLLFAVAFAACETEQPTDPVDPGGEPSENPAPEPGEGMAGSPALVQMASGGGQTTSTGTPAADPLVVFVADDLGRPVTGEAVRWEVTKGSGRVSSTTSLTNEAGESGVRFTGGLLGESVVEARVEGIATPVVFSISTTRVRVWMQHDTYRTLGIVTGAPMPVPRGATVEWENLDPRPHTATSVAVPAGAAPFNSGPVGVQDLFSYRPSFRGTYVFRCALHPDEPEATIVVE